MNLSRNTIHQNIYLISCLCIAFFLPIARLVPMFIVVMFLNWLIEGDFKNKFRRILTNKFALLFISFYLLHIVGLIFTENMDSGLFDLQVKLSLLIFPLIIASKPFGIENKQKIFYTFIAGCISSIIIMLTRATFLYFSTGENHFFYESLSSYLIHPSYFSMYLNVAIVWLILNIQRYKLSENPRMFFLGLFLILLFSIIILMLSSKLGIITTVLIYIGFLLFYLITRKKYMLGFLGFLIIGLSIFIVMRFVPIISSRINNAINAVSNPSINEAEVESSAVRLLVWSACNEVVSDNLIIGVGTGDAKDELMKVYKSRGMTGAYAHELNAHNEYYQVFISLGIIGFILLLSILYFPLIFAFRNGNIIYLLFLLIIILNFLTESMFETQAGVMFYAFFNSLLCFQSKNKKEEIDYIQIPTTNN